MRWPPEATIGHIVKSKTHFFLGNVASCGILSTMLALATKRIKTTTASSITTTTKSTIMKTTIASGAGGNS